MSPWRALLSVPLALAAVAPLAWAGGATPVTPKASPEATQLLQFLYDISGKQTLVGQHAPPLLGTTQLGRVYKMMNHYPALFGQDFGFSAPGTWDGINYRQQLVDEAIRRHAEGFIIALMWHAVRPIEDEPVEFKTSVQGPLTDRQWHDLVTPGTEVNERWKSQVDVIAWHLKQLRDAGVPVLWRPYHEMNGNWFWWGQKKGDDGYRRLYRMLFDRLVNFHHLDNLVWVFGANEVTPGVDPYETYFPGRDVVDVLATDVYHGSFQKDYDALLTLASGKPIALAEVGRVPPLDILEAEPRWAWFMTWGDPMGIGSTFADLPKLRAVYESERCLTWDKLPWVNDKQPKIHAPILK
jgi:mannan endo-1,4-beta-mannosidase